MNFKRFLGKVGKALDIARLKAKISYSQVGEDLVVDYLFSSLGLRMSSYLEIGTNHPVQSNNTYLFYKKGCKGVCIEPDIDMYKIIQKERPRDIVLNIGIGLSEAVEAPFYLFPGLLNGWSTFSEEEAIIRERESGLKAKKVYVPLKTINDIIDQYFDACPNFISLDVEGLDLAILRTFNLERFRPEVICVETIDFSINNQENKMQDTIEFMHSKGYVSYADTHVNTIFCRSELFNGGK